MKILTLNTHSLLEENYTQKLNWFVEGILREKPDLIAMQEVNQSFDAPEIDPEMLEGQFPVPGYVTIREDNHVAQVVHRLRQAGISCSWTWLPVKSGYGKYDEGVAVISLSKKIQSVDTFPISKVNDYSNWRTRKVLGVQLEGMEDWFYSIHMGCWDDPAEPFLHQWKVLNGCVASKRICGPVWLLGEFSAPTCFRGESYDTIAGSGWFDTYCVAQQKDKGITFPRITEGWEDKLTDREVEGMRLACIWCSQKKEISSSCVVFNGERQPIVSDHFGVMIETKE